MESKGKWKERRVMENGKKGVLHEFKIFSSFASKNRGVKIFPFFQKIVITGLFQVLAAT